MEGQVTNIAGLVIPSTDPLFLGIVGLHVLFGLGCVIFGLAAMLAKKGRGTHSTLGTIYFWCMGGAFVTMATLSVIRWREDYYLFALGALAFGLVSVGRLAVRQNLGLRTHTTLMGSSYIVLLTAFYVDNGKNLPLWRDLPSVVYWFLPTIVGAPLIGWALARQPLLRRG